MDSGSKELICNYYLDLLIFIIEWIWNLMIMKLWLGDIGFVWERGFILFVIIYGIVFVGNFGFRNKVEYVIVFVNCGLWDGVSEWCSY